MSEEDAPLTVVRYYRSVVRVCPSRAIGFQLGNVKLRIGTLHFHSGLLCRETIFAKHVRTVHVNTENSSCIAVKLDLVFHFPWLIELKFGYANNAISGGD